MDGWIEGWMSGLVGGWMGGWNDESGWYKLICAFGVESKEAFYSRARATVSLPRRSV